MKRIPKAKTVGHKAGTKRRDMRWIDAQGEEWASRFECLVYESGKRQSLKIRKCDKGSSDTVAYISKVRSGRCKSCQSTDVIQERSYTPDLCVLPSGAEASTSVGENGFYIEVKGYTRAAQRSLLRSICKAKILSDLRFILQADYRVTRSLTFGQWIDKFLKCRWAIWNGEFPTKWNYNEPKKSKSSKKRNK